MANQYQSELNEQRKVATKLLSRGQVTVAEIAAYYGLARQTVQRWVDTDGIDVAAARKAWIGRKVDQAKRSK